MLNKNSKRPDSDSGTFGIKSNLASPALLFIGNYLNNLRKNLDFPGNIPDLLHHMAQSENLSAIA